MTTSTSERRFASDSLELVLEVAEGGDVRLLSLRPTGAMDSHPGEPEGDTQPYRMVELQITGENWAAQRDAKHLGTLPGARLRLDRFEEREVHGRRRLSVHLADPTTGARVETVLELWPGSPVLRTWTRVENAGSRPFGIEYLSSFALTGVDRGGQLPRDEKLLLHLPHNGWFAEAQWRHHRLPELGLEQMNGHTLKRLAVGSVGTWSSSQFAPVAVLENVEAGRCLFWQIEHNGSWQWELGDVAGQLYLRLWGPTETDGHFWKRLAPGEAFEGVPVAVGVVEGDLDAALGALTTYRRALRRPSLDDARLPVIFNDYMNCLFGDPTTAKLLPLVEAAADAGCEVFCIDCGWYSDGPWWDGVGEWLPSPARFPGGLGEVLDRIRARGMVPGLWLELEVMGIRCPLAARVPDDWFFVRHGHRVIENGRYQLDFRNAAVRAHADAVIDRLVREYGVGYVKMDYNINAGVGTELGADSLGDGLLGHNRAYLAWLDAVFGRYPELVVENCGSGGMRMDYALLARHSLQSCSDQTDYRRNGVIAAAVASLVAPEQAAIWSYPLAGADPEEVAFNMVNAMLLRIHQSGHLAELDAAGFSLVREGIETYKRLRADIPRSLPVWPSGLPTMTSPWTSFGLVAEDVAYLAVWRLDGAESARWFGLPGLAGLDSEAELLYPRGAACDWSWNPRLARLSVALPSRHTARLFRIRAR